MPIRSFALRQVHFAALVSTLLFGLMQAASAQTAYTYFGNSADGSTLYAYTITQGSMSGTSSYTHGYYATIGITGPNGTYGTNDGTSYLSINAGTPAVLRRDTQISSLAPGSYRILRHGWAFCTFVGSFPFYDTGEQQPTVMVPPIIHGVGDNTTGSNTIYVGTFRLSGHLRLGADRSRAHSYPDH
ncbi:MAG: hypothetical protein ABI693_03235 [Bryobacteraceae bacterium]